MAQDSWMCFLSPARFNIGEEISTKNWDTIFFILLWPIYLSENIYFMKSEFNGKFIPFIRRGKCFPSKNVYFLNWEALEMHMSIDFPTQPTVIKRIIIKNLPMVNLIFHVSVWWTENLRISHDNFTFKSGCLSVNASMNLI